MKKFVAGIIIGSVLSFTISAHADELASLVGKEIQGEFPVTLNGEQLTNQAAVVDGTSYLPVRAIGEALNLEVSFNAETGIALTDKEETEVQLPVEEPQNTQEKPQQYTLGQVQAQIDRLEVIVHSHKGFIQLEPNSPLIDQYKTELEKYQKELEFWKAEKAKLQ